MDQLEDQKEALGDMNQEINHMVADDDFELENEYASLINEAAELREGIREHSKPLHALTTSAKTEAQRPVATKEELKKMDDVMDESEFEEDVSGLKKPHVPADSHIEEPEIVELERRTEANKRKEANLC
ncbi:unnamed protein product [Brassica oleracea var. botrytis]|uniref:Uncharacterized protein n=1 Tax=Brassica oleracea TaxID=3712 RepID=A0A3P6H0U6_BRAOL|nr:unnamed protein product [Brassica oleracea]